MVPLLAFTCTHHNCLNWAHEKYWTCDMTYKICPHFDAPFDHWESGPENVPVKHQLDFNCSSELQKFTNTCLRTCYQQRRAGVDKQFWLLIRGRKFNLLNFSLVLNFDLVKFLLLIRALKTHTSVQLLSLAKENRYKHWSQSIFETAI